MIATATKTETPQLTEGWHPGIPMEEYRRIPALSSSLLWEFFAAPARYLFRSRNPKEPTPAMRLGTATHTLLLEPVLMDRYLVLGQCEAIVQKTGIRCANPGRAWRDGEAFCGVKGHDPEPGEPPCPDDYNVVTAEQRAQMEGMQKAVLGEPYASQFFRGKGRSEVTGIWRDEETGVWLKIRLDRQIERASIHADIKVTQDANEEPFYRVARNLGYFAKAALYRRVMAGLDKPAKGSVLIALEAEARLDRGNGPEHGCIPYVLAEVSIESWNREITKLLHRFAKCQEAGVWPGYEDREHDLVPLECKPWDLPNQEHELALAADEYDPDAPLPF